MKAWLNTIMGGLVVILLAYIANAQNTILIRQEGFNYRLTRIEQELGIKPISLSTASAIARSAR